MNRAPAAPRDLVRHNARRARTDTENAAVGPPAIGTYAIGYPLANARQSGGSPAGDRWQWQWQWRRPFAA